MPTLSLGKRALPLTFGAGGLAVLALGYILVGGPKATDAGKQKQGEEIENALYDLLRKDGMIRFDKCPWEMYVKRVAGRKLIDMEFKRRDKTGQCNDVVARAREGELHVHLPTKQLLVRMRHCFVVGGAGRDGFVEDKVWSIDLPAEVWK
jgi:hypothetical protein